MNILPLIVNFFKLKITTDLPKTNDKSFLKRIYLNLFKKINKAILC